MWKVIGFVSLCIVVAVATGQDGQKTLTPEPDSHVPSAVKVNQAKDDRADADPERDFDCLCGIYSMYDDPDDGTSLYYSEIRNKTNCQLIDVAYHHDAALACPMICSGPDPICGDCYQLPQIKHKRLTSDAEPFKGMRYPIEKHQHAHDMWPLRVPKAKGSPEFSHPKEGWKRETAHFVEFKTELPKPFGSGTSLQTVYVKLFTVEVLADADRVNAAYPQTVKKTIYIGYELPGKVPLEEPDEWEPPEAVTGVQSALGFTGDNQTVGASYFARRIIFNEHNYLVLLKYRRLQGDL